MPNLVEGLATPNGILAQRVRTLEVQEPMCDHAKARSNAGQNIPTGAAWHILIFEDEVYDTGLEYDHTTGELTCGRDGYLHVTAAILYDASTAWGAIEYAQLAIYVDGAPREVIDRDTDFSGANIYVQLSGSDTIEVAQGEVVTIRTSQTSGGGRTLFTSTTYNYVCFDWLR